jgi:hypothetical protein
LWRKVFEQSLGRICLIEEGQEASSGREIVCPKDPKHKKHSENQGNK